MKQNYKSIIGALSLLFAFSVANAQTTETTRLNATSSGITTFPFIASTVNLYSDVVLDGATFRIKADLTAATTTEGHTAQVYVNNATITGVQVTDGDDNVLTGDGAISRLDYINGESLFLNNFSVEVTDGGANNYTTAAITNLRFTAVELDKAGGDNPQLILNGSSGGTVDLGNLATNNDQLITFGTTYSGADDSSISVPGDATTVTEVTVNAANDALNGFAYEGVDVAFEFTAITLSTEDIEEATLVIVPTVVSDSFTVNKDFKSVELVDVTGKTVKTFGASDALEVSGVTSGLYIVKVLSKSGAVSTSRLIVE